MSSSKRVKLDMTVIAVAVITLLLVAWPSQGRPDYEDQQDQDHNDDGNDSDEHVGASRSWGGNNKTEHVADFPWIYVLFRNPDDEYKWPLDGYQTGYAIEMQHNLFLVHNTALQRASKDGELMAAKRAKDLVTINPNKSEWPSNGQRGLGNMTLLLSIGLDFGIYRLEPHNRSNFWPPWPQLDRQGSLPKQPAPWLPVPRTFLDPSIEVRLYPVWNEDKNLATNCYVYTFAAQDWKDVERGASELGVPQDSPHKLKEDKFYASETRTFTRWPVKLAEPCNKGGCRFVFDSDRYWEEHMKGRYMAKRARGCTGWQDVGAPIMCGDAPPLITGYHAQGVYYERKYLKLSYVVRGVRQQDKEDFPTYDPKRDLRAQCYKSLIATRLADHSEAFRPIFAELKKKYWAYFRETHKKKEEREEYFSGLAPLGSFNSGR